MMMTAKFLATSTPFNRFLYAGVGDDKNGMELTLLSALARQNMDPWQQAADLSRLPAETAVRNLATMLELLPGQGALVERTALAGRLISLLPNPADIRQGGTAAPRRAPANERSERATSLVVLLIYCVAIFAGSWWFSNHSATDAAVQPAVQSGPVAPIAAEKARPTFQGR
jgi:hypothetical protein